MEGTQPDFKRFVNQKQQRHQRLRQYFPEFTSLLSVCFSSGLKHFCAFSVSGNRIPLQSCCICMTLLLAKPRSNGSLNSDAQKSFFSLVTTSWLDFLCPSENQRCKTLPAHPVRTGLQAVCHPEKALEPKLGQASQTWLSLLCHHCPGRNNPLMQSGPVHAWAPTCLTHPQGGRQLGLSSASCFICTRQDHKENSLCGLAVWFS